MTAVVPPPSASPGPPSEPSPGPRVAASPGAPPPGPRSTTRRRWLVRAAWLNLALQVLIVVTGGIVRLTASGLGCPTWPECTPGSIAPTADQVEGIGKIIEFGNRLLTFAVGLGAIAVLATALRWRRDLWPLAVLPLLGTLGQAVLGGITVLTALHPATVAGHFLLSMLLIAASTALLLRAREPRAPVSRRVSVPLRLAAGALVATGAVVLVLGTVTTGSGPHSGDADEPVRFALDVDTASSLHANAVMIFTGLLAGYVLTLWVSRETGRPMRWALVMVGLVVVQGVVGYVQYFLGLPRPLVAVHMLLAALFAAVLTVIALSTRSRDPVAPSGLDDRRADPDPSPTEPAGPAGSPTEVTLR